MKSHTVTYQPSPLDKSIKRMEQKVNSMTDIDLLLKRMNLNKIHRQRYLKDSEFVQYTCVFNELKKRNVGQWYH